MSKTWRARVGRPHGADFSHYSWSQIHWLY